MSTGLIVIALLALAVGVIVLIIHAVKKSPMKRWGIIAISGLVLLVTGCVAAPSEAEFTITSCSVAPKEVMLGESVTITAVVENTGGTEGVYHAVLLVDRVETESKNISVAAGGEETLSFSVTRESAGFYQIELEQFKDTFRVLAPAEFEVKRLIISPNTVKVGEETTVEVEIKNVGGTEGTYTASLVVDGVVEQTKDVTLAEGATGKVSFLISRDEPGSYKIEIGGLELTLDVIEPVRLPTGTLLVKELHGNGELTIENGLDLDAVAVLSSTEEPEVPLLAVYVQANDSCTTARVSDGTYMLYFAVGEDWDEASKKFTKNAGYNRFEHEFEWKTTRSKYKINYTIWTVTLHPVVGGTAGTESLSEDEFPQLG